MQQDENDYKQNVKDSNTFREETGGSQAVTELLCLRLRPAGDPLLAIRLSS
jgi:hypothetical protein